MGKKWPGKRRKKRRQNMQNKDMPRPQYGPPQSDLPPLLEELLPEFSPEDVDEEMERLLEKARRNIRMEAAVVDPAERPARQQLLAELDRKLLALGGVRVSHREHDDQYAESVLARGSIYTLPVKPRKGRFGFGHSNAAKIWEKNVKKYQLVVGYVLKNGVWSPHSWVVDGKQLHDPSDPAEQYFGVPLSEKEAIQFWFTHYLPDYYPGAIELIMALGE
jgi:hypothetical protein